MENEASTADDGRSGVEQLPAEQLEAEIVLLARHLSAGTYDLLVMVGELDARGTWATWGALSCAAWLADACDIEPSTARTQVRVARAMRAHTELGAGMAGGDVSYAKARVLVPHLTDDNADALVGLAAVTPAGRLGAAIDHRVMSRSAPMRSATWCAVAGRRRRPRWWCTSAATNPPGWPMAPPSPTTP